MTRPSAKRLEAFLEQCRKDVQVSTRGFGGSVGWGGEVGWKHEVGWKALESHDGGVCVWGGQYRIGAWGATGLGWAGAPQDCIPGSSRLTRGLCAPCTLGGPARGAEAAWLAVRPPAPPALPVGWIPQNSPPPYPPRPLVQHLARLKHPSVVRLVAPLEETRTQLVFITGEHIDE